MLRQEVLHCVNMQMMSAPVHCCVQAAVAIWGPGNAAG